MTTEELHELAAAGVSLRIHAIEQQLANYHQGWPELFASPTPPQLLKVLMNGNGHGNGNGHTPAAAAPAATEAAPVDKRRAPWTQERRAKHARAMRRAAKGHQKAKKRAAANG